MRFAENFLLGAASSATQVEGGDVNNSWYDWCKQGRIADNSDCLRGTDHWNLFEEDFSLMTDMGLQCYRLGLEWSRIESIEGEFSLGAIGHYRDMIDSLIKKGIRPLVTLFHFSLPIWLADRGGFENSDSIEYFDRYVAFVVENLGDIVGEYITINEPNVYVAKGYFLGEWPPGKRSFLSALKVYKNLSIAHYRAYITIHEVRERMIKDLDSLASSFDEANRDEFPSSKIERETMVGVAFHLQILEAYNPKNPLDRIAASVMRFLFQTSIIDSMTSGWLSFPIGRGNPCKVEEPSDFIGINYYSRAAVKAKGFENTTFPSAEKNDLGWEVYPDGMYQLCKQMHERYKLPIWITENGCADNDDAFRARFIREHLEAIASAQADGVPVDRYYHWSLTDNFEWLEGESSRFGLIHVDYESMERQIKKSGNYYAEIIKRRELSPEIDDAFGIDMQVYNDDRSFDS